ncbi:MAG TPA: cyclic lactone autoinducer peptide [Firmicutes bacterium]|jgi:cyclic lactone autoinducer peptide|nr:cyclic lactone autoinducer peptide [Bacillota bacterium]HAA37629.1 cyclic lactone autoinducer peptide [Bacillota bacterium]
MKKRILSLLAGLLTLIALGSAASACWAILYQPKLPEALKRR